MYHAPCRRIADPGAGALQASTQPCSTSPWPPSTASRLGRRISRSSSRGSAGTIGGGDEPGGGFLLNAPSEDTRPSCFGLSTSTGVAPSPLRMIRKMIDPAFEALYHQIKGAQLTVGGRRDAAGGSTRPSRTLGEIESLARPQEATHHSRGPRDDSCCQAGRPTVASGQPSAPSLASPH